MGRHYFRKIIILQSSSLQDYHSEDMTELLFLSENNDIAKFAERDYSRNKARVTIFGAE